MTDPDRLRELREYVAGKHPASEVPMTAGEVQELFDALDAAERERDAARLALDELVACKDLKERAEDLLEAAGGSFATVEASMAYCEVRNEYLRRKPAAWAAARALATRQEKP